jgi:hypothetical protein
MHDNDDSSDPDIGQGGAFVCAASLPAQGLSLARLASAFRPKNSEPAADAAVARAVAAAVAAWSTAPKNRHHDDGKDDAVHASDCGRLVRAGSSTLTTTASGSGGGASPITETFTHPHAALAVRPRVRDCIHLCPILGAPVTSSTLARVVPYALATRSCFVAIAGTIDNAADLERRFAPRLAASSASSALRGAQSMPPLPSFEAARDEALANEVACLSLTPPGGLTVGSPSSSRTRSAALSGVRRAVDAGEAAARAVLALVEDAVAGSGARAAESPAQALTLALTEIQGSFALALHDADRGFTLAARDASGEEELWFCLTPDSVVFASPCPIDLGAAAASASSSPRAASGWHPLPAGHFVVCGGGFGRQPRLHQYALTPEQLSVRAASHEHEQAPRSRSKRDGGVSLSSAASFDAAHNGGASAAAAAFAPVSPHSSSFDDLFHE